MIEYDSGADAHPTGQAREMGESLQPLIGMDIQLTMTPPHRRVAAEPGEAGRGLFEPGKPGNKRLFRQLPQLLKQSLVFQEAVDFNDEWREDHLPRGGTSGKKTTYRLAGLTGARWPAGPRAASR